MVMVSDCFIRVEYYTRAMKDSSRGISLVRWCEVKTKRICKLENELTWSSLSTNHIIDNQKHKRRIFSSNLEVSQEDMKPTRKAQLPWLFVDLVRMYRVILSCYSIIFYLSAYWWYAWYNRQPSIPHVSISSNQTLIIIA